VWAYVEQNWGTLGPAPALGMEAWLTPRNVSSHLCYRAKFGHSRSNLGSVITEIRQEKNVTLGIPPFEVIGTGTDP